MPHLTMEYR